MDGRTEEDPSGRDAVGLEGPEKGHDEHAEEALAAAAGADVGDHGIEEPDTRVLEAGSRGEATPPEQDEYHPAG